jgi:hypothetical protein
MDKVKKMRWNPYVLLKNEGVIKFWEQRFLNQLENEKLLFILGKGFDPRMNLALRSLMESCPNINIECWMITFDEGANSSSHKYSELVDENLLELGGLLSSRKLAEKKIKIWDIQGKKRTRVGDQQASRLISGFDEISEFSDIIVDVSALPRGVYFSFIGRLLALVDYQKADISKPNIYVSIAENASIDSKIREFDPGEVYYPRGFGGGVELASEHQKPLIWFPILGEERKAHTTKAFEKITETKDRLYEICPTLPFPSKDPRRSDTVLINHHSILFDEFTIEPQNITYIPEQNPFESYIQLSQAILNYKKSLKILSGCKAVISPFSSKILSIAALLTAYENQEDVAILNVDSDGYEIDDEKELKKMGGESELILTWLSGIPYEKIEN